MAEPTIVIEHREHLWYLLAEAAQVEHLIMCQYLYASFSLKAGPEDGLTAEQAAAVARWREVLTGIAVEEMLHLALVFNVMTAIGAAPPLSRPNFPRRSDAPSRRSGRPGDLVLSSQVPFRIRTFLYRADAGGDGVPDRASLRESSPGGAYGTLLRGHGPHLQDSR